MILRKRKKKKMRKIRNKIKRKIEICNLWNLTNDDIYYFRIG